jgi:hypothetical protein
MDKRLRRIHISARDFEKALRFIERARIHDIASLEHEAAPTHSSSSMSSGT